MPHDIAHAEFPFADIDPADLNSELPEEPAPQDQGEHRQKPSILAQMKKAGRALVKAARRIGTKSTLAAVMAAGAAIALPAVAKAQDGYCAPGCGHCLDGPHGAFCADGEGNPQTSTNSNGSSCTGPSSVLDPVNVVTGNVYLHQTDYSTAGQNPLQFIRYYNSNTNPSQYPITFANGLSSSITAAATLGPNWRSNYDAYLQIYPAVGPGQVAAERPDGQELLFTLGNTGQWFADDSNEDYTLTQSGSSWTLKGPDDTVEVYGSGGTAGTSQVILPMGATFLNTNGTTGSVGIAQLSSITLRNGYTQTLNYGSSAMMPNLVALLNLISSNPYSFLMTTLQSVTDSYGRQLNFNYNGNNRLQTVTTPDNLVLTYGYTAINSSTTMLTSVGYNTSPATSQQYAYTSSAGPSYLTAVTDENGHTSSSWTYDSSGRAITSKNGGSLGANAGTLTYNSDGTTTVKNALGVADTYTFQLVSHDSQLKVSQISRAATSTTAAATESFGYDSNGYMNSFFDWNGNETTAYNNAQGNPLTITESVSTPIARTTTVTYDPTWIRLPSTITVTGLTRGFSYDGNGNPLTITDTDTTTNAVPYSTNGQTRTTQLTWTPTGQLLSVQLPRTDATVKTSFGYDGTGALTSVTDPLSHVTNITSHTGGGYPTTIVDPNNVTTTLGWDTRLNLNTVTLATTAGNLTTTYTHDAANNLTAFQAPDGSKLTYTLDAANRLTKITDLLNNTINYTLDALGDATKVQIKNPSGTVTWQDTGTFDALGRLTKNTNGVNQFTAFTWDPNSNLLTVTPPSPSGAVTFTWDGLNRLATRVDPSPGGTTTFTLDSNDNLTNVKDANGNSTAYTRDGFGEAIQVVSPDTGTTVATYDPDRNLTQKVFAGGQTANLTYDAKDRNLTVSYPADSTLNIAKTYDQAGHGFGVNRLTSVTDQAGSDSFTFDERANITNENRTVTGVGTITTTTGYDKASRVASIGYPSGTAVNYSRDTMGNVTAITAQPPGASSASNVATGIAYAPFGAETALTFGNGITGAYAFDANYRPTTRTDASGSTNILKHTYAYYNNDSLHTLTDAVAAANSQTLGFDALDRLTSATSGTGGYGSYAWTWDKVSNVVTQTVSGTKTTFNLVSGSNQLASTVTGGTTTTVDTTANGNILDTKIGSTVVTSNTYNAANQMASALGSLGSSASYQYGFDGQRIEKAPPGTNPILYQYSRAANELLSENDLHQGHTADYIYMDPGRNSRPVGEVNPTTGALYFMHTNLREAPEKVTDSGKNVVWSAQYNPFGDISTGKLSGTLTIQSLRLPGQQMDPETGNYHNGFRDYAGTLTRYVQSDPIGLGGGMNTYQYVLGNPFKYSDRLGLDPGSNSGGGQGGMCMPSDPMCGAGNGGPGNMCMPGDPMCTSSNGSEPPDTPDGDSAFPLLAFSPYPPGTTDYALLAGAFTTL